MMNDNPYIQWLKEKKLADTTIYLYWRYYQRFKEYPFTQDGIDQFFKSKKVNNSISHAFIKSLLEFLDLTDQFKLPPKIKGKKRQKIIRDISQKQIRQIRSYGYETNFIMGFLFDLIYYGALRRSELCKIRINSFNWDLFFEDTSQPCELHLEMAKGNKDRVVLIPAKVVYEFVGFYLKKNNIKPQHIQDLVVVLNNSSDPIFIQKQGGLLSGWKVWQIIKQLSKRAIGIEIRPHELRHARATELEKQGHNLRTIQHYLGHSSPQITEIYLHTSEKQSLSKIKETMLKEN